MIGALPHWIGAAWIAFWVGFVGCLGGIIFFDVRENDAALHECPPIYDRLNDDDWWIE